MFIEMKVGEMYTKNHPPLNRRTTHTTTRRRNILSFTYPALGMGPLGTSMVGGLGGALVPFATDLGWGGMGRGVRVV